MKLKKIKILGFKSFADKVELSFHEGITCIVGPNGCGKSNIADAFRWVMGEQSAKSMRGGKMLDVIFAGTSKRKPLNFVEVSLTFINDDHELPVAYHEVEITRKYSRNGDSDYFINGNQVRLKDVHSMLIDVGLGKNSYAIFEQGKIDQVIQLSPVERRTIFEEAAGILKFLINKKEALRKLEQVDLNTSRLSDIQKEVGAQVGALQAQAKRLTAYQTLKQQLTLYEKESLRLKGELTSKKRQESSRQIEEFKTLESEGLEKGRRIQTELEEFKARLEETNQELKEKERADMQLKSLSQVRLKEFETLAERRSEANKKQKSLEKELELLKKEMATRSEEIVKSASQQESLASNLSGQEARLLKEREQFRAFEKEYERLQKEYAKTQEEHIKQLKIGSEASSKLKEASLREEALQEKIQRIKSEAGKLRESLADLAEEEEEKREGLEASKELVEKEKEEFSRLDQAFTNIQQENEAAQIEFEAVQQELYDLRAREKALLKLKEDYEGFSQGGKEILKEALKPESPFYNQIKGLYEYFDVSSGFEEAISSVLKPYADTLVASDRGSFEACLKWAEENKLTEFSLICCPLARAFESNEENALLKRVEMNPLSCHFLKDKRIAKSLPEAFTILSEQTGLEIFSLDGYFIDHAHVVFKQSQKGASPFLRESELKNVVQKIHDRGALFETYKVRLEEIKNRQIQADPRAANFG